MPRVRFTMRATLVGVALAGAVIGGVLRAGAGSRGPLALSHSGSLRRVVEPITIVHFEYYRDGGSIGLAFDDAKGVRRFACLESDMFGGSAGSGHLDLDSIEPARGVQVPFSGVDERAFLGLLERWSAAKGAVLSLPDKYALAVLKRLRLRN